MPHSTDDGPREQLLLLGAKQHARHGHKQEHQCQQGVCTPVAGAAPGASGQIIAGMGGVAGRRASRESCAGAWAVAGTGTSVHVVASRGALLLLLLVLMIHQVLHYYWFSRHMRLCRTSSVAVETRHLPI